MIAVAQKTDFGAMHSSTLVGAFASAPGALLLPSNHAILIIIHDKNGDVEVECNGRGQLADAHHQASISNNGHHLNKVNKHIGPDKSL